MCKSAARPAGGGADRDGERLDLDVARRTTKENSSGRRMETYRAAAGRHILYLGLRPVLTPGEEFHLSRA